jgi:polar amino acid transport system permease protein
MGRLAETFFNVEVIAKYLPALLAGFRVTLQLAAAVVALGLLLGLALAMLRAFRFRLVNALIVTFVDIFRTLPQLVVMVFAYFGLPYAGITISAFAAAVLGLGLVLAAFAEEAFWAAITAIPRGQWEAARSTGLSFGQALGSVVMPQAVRISIPLLTNRTIAITKGTALASVISVPEILDKAQSAMSLSANASPLIVGAALYLTIFGPFVVFSRWLERRYGWII